MSLSLLQPAEDPAGAHESPSSPPQPSVAVPGPGFAVLAMLAVNLIPCVLSLTLPNFDAETHLFMADHYRKAWFDPWETRWFGGFWMFSYPPLVHQLIALLAHAIGLEAGYVTVELTLLLALPLAVWLLGRELAGEAGGRWAALFSVAPAGVYLCLYGYGQLPTLAGLDLMLAASAFLTRWLRRGRLLDLAAAVTFGATTLAAHHLTGLGGLTWLAIAVTLLVAIERPRWAVGGRALVAALLLAVATAAVIAPFAWWLITCHKPQSEILHASRTPFFSSRINWYTMFVGVWGGALLALGPALWISAKRPPLAAITALVLLWGTLGLGYYTRLPQLLFPGWAHWLTYERFTLWASVLVLVPLGARLALLGPSRLPWALLALFGAFAAASAASPAWLHFLPNPPEQPIIDEMARFVDNGGRYRWHYVTIGLGEQAMARLSRTATASTIDGLYYTARRDPYFNQIGMGPFDAGQWSDHGPRTFWVQQNVLARPQLFGIKWGFSAGDYGNEQFRHARWKLLGYIGPEGFIPAPTDRPHLWRVTVWQAPASLDIPTVDERDPRPPPPPSPLAFLWGVAPLCALASALVSSRLALRGKGAPCTWS
jgi:hypothetical protein